MNLFILLFILIVGISIAGLIGLHVVWDRDHAIADATADAVNLRNALSEPTRQTFAAIDLALLERFVWFRNREGFPNLRDGGSR